MNDVGFIKKITIELKGWNLYNIHHVCFKQCKNQYSAYKYVYACILCIWEYLIWKFST